MHVASASPYEPHLVPATLDARFLPDLPWCLIGDRGYDSDGLDDLLMTQYGIEMIAANRRGRAKTQNGRPLRRATRHWKIERSLPGSTTAAAWLFCANSRRENRGAVGGPPRLAKADRSIPTTSHCRSSHEATK